MSRTGSAPPKGTMRSPGRRERMRSAPGDGWTPAPSPSASASNQASHAGSAGRPDRGASTAAVTPTMPPARACPGIASDAGSTGIGGRRTQSASRPRSTRTPPGRRTRAPVPAASSLASASRCPARSPLPRRSAADLHQRETHHRFRGPRQEIGARRQSEPPAHRRRRETAGQPGPHERIERLHGFARGARHAA